MSDTILWIARASAHAKFLKDFYGFTTIIETGNVELLYDYSPEVAPDVVLLTDFDGNSGIIIGVVNQDTLKLSSTWSALQYKKNSLWYRSVSQTEITQVRATPSLAYGYNFFPDKVFSNFYMKNFQIENFNSGAILEMMLTIFPRYTESLDGENWEELPQDELFRYSIIF